MSNLYDLPADEIDSKDASSRATALTPQEAAHVSAALVAQNEARGQKWKALQNELGDAMKLWQELEARPTAPSPEEEQLRALRELIAQVKEKLSSF